MPRADEPPTTGRRRTARRAGFRDDIQGMRALAVLAIMLFHAGYSPYPGGFVTLDVFFVVSGFLITFLLLREIERDGNLSLLRFYARRARRILPAAAVVTVATVTASALWLNVVDARDAADDGLWAAFFGANVRFALQQTDYFAREDAPSPLQHYWSLSVEEQFYVLLPVLLVACVAAAVRSARRRHPDADDRELLRRKRRTIGVVVGVVCLASFAWSVHASTASPDTAYFSTFTRTWEFGVGSLLALAAPACARLTTTARNVTALGGVGLIVVACFVVTEQTPFPGWAALMPVAGTGAVMLAGAGVTGDPPVAQRLLGTAPLRWVGDASYSLYLWHWPLLTIATQHLARDLTATETLGVVVLTFALSWASLRWVETPFRRWTPPRPQRSLWLYPASVVVAVSVFAASTTWIDRHAGGDGATITAGDYAQGPEGERLADDPTVALVQASVRAAQEGRSIPATLHPDLLDLKKDKADLAGCDYAEDPPWRLCRRGDPDADRTVVLLGNSHGRAWIPAMEEIAQHSGWAAYYLVKEACTPVRVVSTERTSDDPWQGCSDFNDWAEEQVRELHPDLVVATGSAPPSIVTGDGEVVKSPEALLPYMEQGFEDLLADLEPLAGRVALVADVPRRTVEPADCLGRPGATLRDCLDQPKETASRVTAASRRAARAQSVRYVDTSPWFCADGRCPAVVGSWITMRDQGHVTTDYARRLAEPLGRALGMWGR